MNPADLGSDFANFIGKNGNSGAIYYNPSQVAPDVPGPTPQQTNVPATHGQSGVLGFLERNAQNIGGVLGGIAGELVNPFGGGVVGAGAGSALGQEVKNLTTGTKTNPLEEGAIGAGSELAGLGLGKAAQLVGKGVKNAAPDLFRSAFNLPNKLAARLKPQETAQKMLDYGIGGKSLNGMIKTSEDAMDQLDNLYRQSVNGTDPISTIPVIQAAKKTMNSPYTLEMTDADKQKVSDVLDRLTKNPNGKLEVDSQAAVDNMRALQEVGHGLLAKGENKLNPNQRASEFGQTYLDAADEFQKALDRLTPKANIEALKTPENIASLSSISPKLAEEFKGVKGPQEIRTLMAPFHNLRTMSQITSATPQKTGLLASALGAAGGFGVGGPMGAVAGMLGSPIIQGAENAVRAPLTTGAAKVVNTLSGAGKTANKLVGDLSAGDLARIGVSQGAGQSASGVFGNSPPTLPGDGSNAGVADLVGSSIQNTLGPLNAAKNGSTTTGLGAITTPEELQNVINTVGYKGLEEYLAVQRQESPQLTEAQQKDWLDNQNAINAVSDFARMFDQVKASGAVAGGIEELGTKIPGIQNTKSESALKAYEDNKGDLASSLAQVLGGGKGSKALLTELKSELPDVNDSPQAAAMKLHVLVQRLGANMHTILSAPATNTPGQLANFNGMNVPGTVGMQLPATPTQVNFGGV